MAQVNKKIAVIMVGAPGSGKGTQGEILERKTKFMRIVMSDLIKAQLKSGTDLYDKVINKGVLLNDLDVFDIFNKNFKTKKDIIIDGIPRTENQAYWLYGFLKKHNYEIKVVFLETDEKKLVKRITSRYYCSKCHSSYNILFKKPKVLGKCDFDNSVLIQRKDDTKEIFKDRIKIYDGVKKIILTIYSNEIILVNGDQDIEKVSKEMFNKLNLK